MLTTNENVFKRELQKEFNMGLEQFRLFFKKLVFDAVVGLVYKTPVQLGRARGGWMVDVNQYSDDETGRLDPSGNATIQAANANLAKITQQAIAAGCVVYITNNVKYIIHLEDGTPYMAAVGMWKRTRQELEAVFGS